MLTAARLSDEPCGDVRPACSTITTQQYMHRTLTQHLAVLRAMYSSATDLSHAIIVDGLHSRRTLWEAFLAYLRTLYDACFGRRIRVNARELKLRRQIAEGGASWMMTNDLAHHMQSFTPQDSRTSGVRSTRERVRLLR